MSLQKLQISWPGRYRIGIAIAGIGIAGNFRRTLFSTILETSGIFQKFFYEMVLYRFSSL